VGVPGARPAVNGRLIWVSLPYATFGLIVSGGVVADAAPVAGWAVGKDEREVAVFYRRKGAVFRVVPDSIKIPGGSDGT
jgi:hypothetical protein